MEETSLLIVNSDITRDILTKTSIEKTAELEKIKAQIAAIEQQIRNLTTSKDQLITKGIELQGALKVLEELIKK